MVNNKKGLSTIITTLIIILMVLVAIGIVWYAVLPMIKSGSQQVNYANMCMGIDFKASLDSCTSSGTPAVYSCDITIKREPTSSSTSIDGIELAFADETSSTEDIAYYNDNVITEKKIIANENLIGTDEEDKESFEFQPYKISRVRAYFLDEDGKKNFCTATTQ